MSKDGFKPSIEKPTGRRDSGAMDPGQEPFAQVMSHSLECGGADHVAERDPAEHPEFQTPTLNPEPSTMNPKSYTLNPTPLILKV